MTLLLVILSGVFLLNMVCLGKDRLTGKSVEIPREAWDTHFHLIGSTRKGKTTLLQSMLCQLMRNPHRRDAFFIIDRMGSFSHWLLLWMASPYCPQWVRDRLLYIESSRESETMPFNPLGHTTQAEGYFKVGRAVDCVLRGWTNQNLEEMPRLARWIHNAFWAVAKLGLAIADTAHLLFPGSPYHDAMLNLLPPMLQVEWAEILNARGGEAARMLEAPRNRMKPIYENEILARIYGSTRNCFDALRFMREGRIVLVNLAPNNRINDQMADAIGGMMICEILSAARSLPPGIRYPTYLVLDEFQRFVGPDMLEAIPEVRQKGIRLLLSHQSFSQLEKGSVDMRSLIWQPQSRMMFGVAGEDADLLAAEIASLRYDPKKVKEELFTRRQMLKEQQIQWFASYSESEAEAENWNRTVGKNWNQHEGRSAANSTNESIGQGTSLAPDALLPTRSGNRGRGSAHTDARTDGTSAGGNEAAGQGGSKTTTMGRSMQERLVGVYEEFLELASRTFYQFEEQKQEWARDIRLQITGQVLTKLVNDPTIYQVDVERYAPGHLGWDYAKIAKHLPSAVDALEAMLAKNFASDLFVSPAVIDREREERLERILHPVIEINTITPDEPLLLPALQAGETIPAPTLEVNETPFN